MGMKCRFPGTRNEFCVIRRVLLLSCLLPLLLLTACERFPRDPQQTLDKVLERGTLRVGLVHGPPWVDARSASPGGVEVALVQSFAGELGVTPVWSRDGAEALFTALSHYELDVVIGGITRNNPWTRRVAFTIPWFTGRLRPGDKARHVMAVPAGENAFLMRLEDFLLAQPRTEQVAAMPQAEVSP